MNQPPVTVCVAAYNGELYIRQALDSALAQTYPCMEVVVVNDGSTDSTPRILAEYGGHIRWFTQPNAGQASARNLAVSHARSEWVAMLDQDDLWEPHKLHALFNCAATAADVIYSDSRRIDAEGRVICDRMRHRQAKPHATLLHLIQGNPIVMSTALVKKAAILEVGGFDEVNRYGSDDYQLWLRLAASGHRFHYVDRPLASYRVHDANASLDGLRMRDGGFYALTRVAQEYPHAFGRAEKLALRRAFHSLDFNAGWYLYDRAKYARAFRYFARALQHEPFTPKCWLYLAAMSLPFRRHVLPTLRAVWGTTRNALKPRDGKNGRAAARR